MYKQFIVRNALFFIFPLIFPVLQIAAAPGDVDLSFNGGSFITTQSGVPSVNALELQTDGKIIIGGNFTNINGVSRLSLARLNADGSLDTSFSSPFISASLSSFDTSVDALALQPDGKILVGGSLSTVNGQKNLVRVNTDGTLDTSFSANFPDVLGWIHKIDVQEDGKILCAGQFAGITRLNANGSLDSHLVTSFSVVSNFVRQSSGKIIVSGVISSSFVILRFHPNWEQDTSFHSVNSDGGMSLALQPDDSILIGGSFSVIDSVSRNRLARLTPDGFLDTSFNHPVLTAHSLISKVQPDGKIIIYGKFRLLPDSDWYAAARLNGDGSLDTSFPLLTANQSFFKGLAFQPDGKILVNGDFNNIGGVPRQLVARLLGSNVPQNSPPVLSNVSVSSPINENDTAVLSGSISDADASDGFTLTVDWGDGSAPQVFSYAAGTTLFSETHQYLDDNPINTSSDVYTINLTLNDGNGGSDTDSVFVSVNNTAPVLDGISVNPSIIDVSGITTLSGNVFDAGTQDAHIIRINWGDGSSETTLNLAAGISVFNTNHQYTFPGGFTITVTADDDDGGTVSDSASITVNPLILPPLAPSSLTATVISPTRIDLAWTDNSGDESGFKIERCKGKNCKNFVEIAQVNAGIVSFSDTGVNRNTAYRYRIRAFSSAGNSEYSNIISVKTPRL